MGAERSIPTDAILYGDTSLLSDGRWGVNTPSLWRVLKGHYREILGAAVCIASIHQRCTGKLIQEMSYHLNSRVGRPSESATRMSPTTNQQSTIVRCPGVQSPHPRPEADEQGNNPRASNIPPQEPTLP